MQLCATVVNNMTKGLVFTSSISPAGVSVCSFFVGVACKEDPTLGHIYILLSAAHIEIIFARHTYSRTQAVLHGSSPGQWPVSALVSDAV